MIYLNLQYIDIYLSLSLLYETYIFVFNEILFNIINIIFAIIIFALFHLARIFIII